MDKRDQQPRTRHADQEVQTDASDHPQPILATAADRQSEIPLGHHNAHRLRSRRQCRYPRPAILQQTIPQSHWQQPQPLPRRQSGIPPQHSRRAIDQARQLARVVDKTTQLYTCDKAGPSQVCSIRCYLMVPGTSVVIDRTPNACMRLAVFRSLMVQTCHSYPC